MVLLWCVGVSFFSFCFGCHACYGGLFVTLLKRDLSSFSDFSNGISNSNKQYVEIECLTCGVSVGFSTNANLLLKKDDNSAVRLFTCCCKSV